MHEKTPKKEKPRRVGAFLYINYWRREPESNRPKRLCRPLHNRFAIAPQADWNLAADSQVCLATEDQRTKQKGKRCFPLVWSGRRGSNSRPQPWQGCALPTELLPHCTASQRLALLLRQTTRCFENWSGRRGSNSRPQPWQGCALPTELLPRITAFVLLTTAFSPLLPAYCFRRFELHASEKRDYGEMAETCQPLLRMSLTEQISLTVSSRCGRLHARSSFYYRGCMRRHT